MMSSQEEYLDRLLKGVVDGERVDNDSLGSFDADFSNERDSFEEKERYDVDDVKGMDLDEVNRILEENARKALEETENLEELDLVELMERSNDKDVEEIREFIVKADRNEALDESIVNMIEMAKESSKELPQDILEQMQEEEEEEQENGNGLIGKLFGGKKKKDKKPWETKRAEEFEFENIELSGDMQLIDGDEKNKGRLEAWKDKWKARREAKQAEKEKRAKEKQEEQAKSGEEGKKRRKRAKKLDAALDEMATQPSEEMEETVPNLDLSIKKEIEETASNPGLSEKEEQKQGEIGELDTAALDDLFENADISELEEIREKGEGDAPGSEDPSLGLGLPPDLFGDAEPLTGEGEAGDLSDLLELANKESKTDNKGKKGFFAKLFAFLTEEEEDEDEKKDGEGLILSDENDAILRELDKEDGKKKKKKPKKGKGKEQGAGGEDEEIPEKKEKKEKKPKKPKEPKTKEAEEPGKKLSKKRVRLIFLVCIALGAAFYVLSTVTVEFSEKKKATVAFQSGDYEECYQNLVGKNLNESEQVMFGKSESILRIRLWMKEYEMLAESGQEAEALDSLMQSVHDYPTLYAFSGKWNAVSEVQEVYDQMVEILNSKYGLTEEEAKIIANEEDDLTYSKMVRIIAAGGAFGDWEEGYHDGGMDGRNEESGYDGNGGNDGVDQDLLPEEEELNDVTFIN